MKNLLIFAAGVAIGAVGTLIWLRKDIKKTIEEQNNAKSAAENEKNGDDEDDLPFTMGENGGDVAKNSEKSDENADKVAVNAPVSPRVQQRIEYNKIINEVKNGTGEAIKVPLSSSGSDYKPQIAPVPVIPHDESGVSDSVYDTPYIDEESQEDEESVVPRGEVFFEIDRDEFDNNPEYEKKVFVYYLGDHVMATEAGTKISNPAMFVGVQWDDYVGHYEENASFVRNTRLHEDYQIQVEYGTYADEYGLEDT